MRVCVPITADGQVDPRWGRADRVAVAVAVRHVGPGMQRMLGSMAIKVVDGLSGDARSAVSAAR